MGSVIKERGREKDCTEGSEVKVRRAKGGEKREDKLSRGVGMKLERVTCADDGGERRLIG